MRTTKMLKMLSGIFLSAFARGKVTVLTVVVALTLATITPGFAVDNSKKQTPTSKPARPPARPG
jgi:hypothetical protein